MMDKFEQIYLETLKKVSSSKPIQSEAKIFTKGNDGKMTFSHYQKGCSLGMKGTDSDWASCYTLPNEIEIEGKVGTDFEGKTFHVKFLAYFENIESSKNTPDKMADWDINASYYTSLRQELEDVAEESGKDYETIQEEFIEMLKEMDEEDQSIFNLVKQNLAV